AIDFVCYQTLEHGHGGLFAARRGDGDFTQEGRNAREVSYLGEKAADLHVGVFARLQTPEQLEDQLVAENDGGIGLLGQPDPRRRAMSGVRGSEGGGSAGNEPASLGGGVAGRG